MWMSKNRLKLNANKTQLIWLGTRQQLVKLTVTQLRLTLSVVEFDSTVTDLGVVLDNQLSMQSQVAAVCRLSSDCCREMFYNSLYGLLSIVAWTTAMRY